MEAEKRLNGSLKPDYSLIVIGGGPAGMAAAWSAHLSGVDSILILDRNEYPGGILPQCIHNGFGVGIFGKDYTGPEYAEIWLRNVEEEGLQIRCSTMALKVEAIKQEPLYGGRYAVTCVSPENGVQKLTADAVIFACGCRERTLGQMKIPGTRPSGIFTAGSAQFMVNISNLKPGSRIAILGFGDIGLIMARRLVLEGMDVQVIFGEQANGLVRNYVQCVREFGIETRPGYTLVETCGQKRLEGVIIAPLDEDGHVLEERRERIACDTLLVAAGLIQEDELYRELKGDRHEISGNGICVDEYGKTELAGIFACGNVTEISDLVDKVTLAGIHAGISASEWLADISQQNREMLLQSRAEKWQKINHVLFGKNLHQENCSEADCIDKKIRKYSPAKMNGRLPAEKQLVCTVCPNGCVITPQEDGGFKGQKCRHGAEYAEEYLKNSCMKAILSTTVRLENSLKKLLPVRSDRPLSRSDMDRVMESLRTIRVSAPVEKGKVIFETQGAAPVRILASESASGRFGY